jgi:hypothetical protein
MRTETVSDLAFVYKSLVPASFLGLAKVCRTELKPLLATFGTNVHAIDLIRSDGKSTERLIQGENTSHIP